MRTLVSLFLLSLLATAAFADTEIIDGVLYTLGGDIVVDTISLGGGTVISWNGDEDTQGVEFTHPDGGTVSVNQETYRMWKNADVVAITNGQPVVLFSGAGRVGRIKLAQAGVHATSYPMGVYTGDADLPVDSIGRITRFGAVKGIDLDNLVDGSWVEGAELLLSTNKGRYATNSIAAPVDKVRVAVVTYASPSNQDDIEVAITGHKHWSEMDARYLQDAPSNGTQYARQDGVWTNIVASGGGTITGQVYRIFADAQANTFAAQPDTFQKTNATLSTTHTVAGFDKDSRQLLGADVVYLPGNFNSNITVQCDYFPAGSTNLTTAFFFWYATGSAQYALTNTVTIPACDLTNQASFTFTTNLANAVAGDKIWWSLGIADTNSSSTTRDGSIFVEAASCEFFTQ